MKRLLPLGLALLLPATASAADFDVRSGEHAAAPSQTVRVARTALRRHATLRVDSQTGSVRMLFRRGHGLTRPSSSSAARIARRYLTAHQTALGIDMASLTAAQVVRAPGGLRTVRFGGQARGIPAFDSAVTVAIDRGGRVIEVFGSPSPRLSIPSAVPLVGAVAAMRAFSARSGLALPAVTSRLGGLRRLTRFGNDFARLVVFAAPTGDRLAWHVSLGHFDGVVDATSGRVLRLHDLMKREANAKVYPNYPGAHVGGTPITVDLQAKGYLPAGATTLSGPFVHAHADLLNNDDLLGNGEVARTGAGDFVFPFKSFGNATPRCAQFATCSWDSSTVSSYKDNQSETTVQTFWFDNNWHDHLLAAPIGFDKASGNFDGDDPVDAQTDDTAGLYVGTPAGVVAPVGDINNANMSTPADGSSPTQQMYLGAYDDITLQGLFRDYNNGDDAATVYHEYTHGLSSRLVTNQDGSEALDDDQPGAMGEDWSDWYAFDYLVRQGLSPDTSASSEVDIGIYSDVAPHATRTQGLDCPVQTGTTKAEPCPGSDNGAGPGGYTYGDFGKVSSGPEVHADGEIWGETLWDLRTALVSATGSQDAGSDLAEALVTGGMRLSPPEPSFLDERDAIMNTDVALYGGAHLPLLWTVFAARGMGVDATTTGGADDAPKEGFKLPTAMALTGSLSATPASVAPGGTVSFDATSYTPSSTFAKGYAWDFDGDGTVDQTTAEPRVDHVYPSAGSYVAQVTVTDTHLDTGSATATVTVVAPAATATATPGPTATATATPRPGGSSRPRLRIPPRGTRARFSVRVGCDKRCTVKVKAHLTKTSAGRIGRHPHLTKSRSLRGTYHLRFRLGSTLRRLAKAQGIKVLRVRVVAKAGSRTVKRTVRVRV